MTADDGRPSGGPAAAHDPFNPREAMLGWVRDIAPYGIFTTDADLVVMEWNQWLATHSGLPAAAVVGRPLLELFPDVAERRLDAHFERALKGEIAVLSTALHRYLLPFASPQPDYEAGWMLQTARIAPLAAGDEIVGTITIIEDVTQRECQAAILRRQQVQDQLLSDALANLLAASDPLEAIGSLFPRIAAPLRLDMYVSYLLSPGGDGLRLQGSGGVPPEVRKSIETLSLPDTLSGQVALRRTPLFVANVQADESASVTPARRMGLHAYAGFPLLVGERVMGTLAFGSYGRTTLTGEDIEFLGKLSQYVALALERSQRENALHAVQTRLAAHATELEHKVAERTAKLHETIVQLESFSYTVAHDLRAPIRSLIGFTDILLSDYAATVPAEAQAMLGRLQRASRRLDALTRDLLKFSRITREQVTLAPVVLEELVEEMVAVTPALQTEVLSVVRPLGTVLAQRTLLQQCISNLFDNALKFARPGVPARIVLRAECGREADAPAALHGTTAPFHPITRLTAAPMAAGPRLRVWIEDNGVGIPAHAHEKVWGVFERIPGPVEVEGTGIGLAIVARAVQQMGGSCGVESEPGRGSRFWMEFARA